MKKEYYQIPAERLGEGAKLPILKLGDSGEVFYELAEEMCGAIRANNAAGKHTVFICPVGPVGPMSPSAPSVPSAPSNPRGMTKSRM